MYGKIENMWRNSLRDFEITRGFIERFSFFENSVAKVFAYALEFFPYPLRRKRLPLCYSFLWSGVGKKLGKWKINVRRARKIYLL